MFAPVSERATWLRQVANLADPNTSNAALRDALAQTDPKVLEKLAADIQIKGQSVALLVCIGKHIYLNNGDASPFMKRVQQVYPADFWVNFVLAVSLHHSTESIRYYQAAIAIRPKCAEVRDNLGIVLVDVGRIEDAVAEFEVATRLDPANARFFHNYGQTLGSVGRHETAIEVLRHALEIRPDYAGCYAGIGLNLLELKRPLEAIAECRKAIALDPTQWQAYIAMRTSQLKLGQSTDALATWKEMLDQNPPDHEQWDGYAELCLFLNRPDEYREARRNLLKRFGETTDPIIAERTGRSCLFLAPTTDELRQAMALVDLALKVDTPQARGLRSYHRFAKALAEYRAGRFEVAREYLDNGTLQVLGPAPRLLLAMIQHQLNRQEDALQNYKAALASYNWNLDLTAPADNWRFHLLRRETEAVLKISQ